MLNTDKTYQSKGFMLFYQLNVNDDFDLAYQTFTLDDMLNQHPEELRDVFRPVVAKMFTHSVYNLMPGEEFLDAVRSTCITDDDGTLSDIFVDGFCTDLGLTEAELSQGKFLVSGKVFEKICNEHEVLVNWANK